MKFLTTFLFIFSTSIFANEYSRQEIALANEILNCNQYMHNRCYSYSYHFDTMIRMRLSPHIEALMNAENVLHDFQKLIRKNINVLGQAECLIYRTEISIYIGLVQSIFSKNFSNQLRELSRSIVEQLNAQIEN